jgi:hypothetical protein
MSDDADDSRPSVNRRGLIRRLALFGLAGTVAAGGLMLGQSKPAEAQGYPPLPPPPYEPPPPPPPGPTYIWQPGHWRWNGYRYVWFPGRYVVRGPRYGHFVPGHWAMRYGQWVWVPQHWH